MTKEAFIFDLTQNIPPPPQYFFHDVKQNKSKITSVDEVVKKGFTPSHLPSEHDIKSKHLILLDTRTPKDFEQGHIPGTLNLPLTVNYAIWAGTLFPSTAKFFLITPKGKEKESII